MDVFNVDANFLKVGLSHFTRPNWASSAADGIAAPEWKPAAFFPTQKEFSSSKIRHFASGKGAVI